MSVWCVWTVLGTVCWFRATICAFAQHVLTLWKRIKEFAQYAGRILLELSVSTILELKKEWKYQCTHLKSSLLQLQLATSSWNSNTNKNTIQYCCKLLNAHEPWGIICSWTISYSATPILPWWQEDNKIISLNRDIVVKEELPIKRFGDKAANDIVYRDMAYNKFFQV